jgi:hypothetical protein
MEHNTIHTDNCGFENNCKTLRYVHDLYTEITGQERIWGAQTDFHLYWVPSQLFGCVWPQI